jgi:hypothetical protein
MTAGPIDNICNFIVTPCEHGKSTLAGTRASTSSAGRQ